MDYGHELLFGSFITPSADRIAEILSLAQISDRVGLDLVSVQDHPYQPRFLDTWTLLSVIAAQTERVRVMPNVANLPLRPPAVLARSVATLDLLSGGRAELGLGAGAFWTAIGAIGGPHRTGAESIEALEEGIQIIRAMWQAGGPSVRLKGQHYQLSGAKPGPAPAHDVSIWIGAYKPKMLRLTARLGDGWLPSLGYAGLEEIPAMNEAIDEAANEAGRSPGDIRRLYNINGVFGTGAGFLQGPAKAWAEQLAELTLTQGMSAYILGSDDPDDLARFGLEVAPAVRELVARERKNPAPPLAPPQGLAVPTPDDGGRLSATQLWDDATRPTGPARDPDRVYTAREQATSQHLVDVHDHLRRELAEIRELVDQVAAGTKGIARARSQLNEMTMRQNNWTLGTYCESYCRVVATHHTIEDQSVFPHLRRQDPRLAPVLDRLQEEHHLIHDVLDRVDRALVALVSQPDGLKDLRAAVDQLTDSLLSHLSYEERELIEPLARHSFY
jgi:alkanesulfonate monooxygenase SsuD/methylene tetrahydromethanopterin reductase-like flavin-dependent oxidoreductase (luciferase family)/hemerythrin-like domain-containing protein